MSAEEWDVFSLAPGGSTSAPTFLATLYDAREKQIRVELDGPGSGSFAISRYSTQATETILAQGNLVKVRFPEIDAGYVFAFFLETGDFTLISSDEEGGEMLSFGGRGALAYLAKAVMWNQRYITRWDQPDDITDTGARLYTNISPDNLWHLDLAGTGNKPGQLLGRIIGEARGYWRPQHPIPLCTIDFDYTDDSDGNAWASSDATTTEYTCQVGEPVLDVVAKLVDTGVLTVQMGPDFDLHAYNSATYGRDLSGDDFGAGVVRFEKGVNIVDELQRALGESTIATHILVAGETGNYGDAALSDESARVTQEAYLTAFGTGSGGLDGQGAVELAKRLRDTETTSFQIANRRTVLSLDDPVTVGSVIGGTAAQGYYLPGPPGSDNGDFWVGDTVRVHTGIGVFDFYERQGQIRAITIARDDDNGELIVICDEVLDLGQAPTVPDLVTVYIQTHGDGEDVTGYISFTANSYGDPTKNVRWHLSLGTDYDDEDIVGTSKGPVGFTADHTEGDGDGMDFESVTGNYGPLILPLDTPIYLHGLYSSNYGWGTGYSDGATLFSFWDGGWTVNWSPPAGLSITGYADTPSSGPSGSHLRCGYFVLTQA